MNNIALQWIVGGDTGLSSEAMWAHFMGVEPVQGWYHPLDPGDFGRCARLLALMPEWRQRLAEMGTRSPEWLALTSRWQEIHDQMDREVGIDWSKGDNAVATYRLMKEVMAEGAP